MLLSLPWFRNLSPEVLILGALSTARTSRGQIVPKALVLAMNSWKFDQSRAASTRIGERGLLRAMS
jgi:hypothetical protein